VYCHRAWLAQGECTNALQTINGNLNHRKEKDQYVIKTKENRNTKPQANFTQSGTEEVSVGTPRVTKKSGRRAYEIYLERGEQPGRDLDDWLQAERELERGHSRTRSG